MNRLSRAKNSGVIGSVINNNTAVLYEMYCDLMLVYATVACNQTYTMPSDF